MILQREISKIAEQKGVAKTTIDKDWVLGHFIDAIFSIPTCRENLIFKGGTCLRKCYLRDYRFSEDLDFTAIDREFVLSQKIVKKIVQLITSRTEIPLHLESLKPLVHENQVVGFTAKIKFWGADHSINQLPPAPSRWQSSIKIEVILFEKVVFTSEQKPVFHEYSDTLSDAARNIPCYSIEEILSEKFRALIQRSYPAPRDYYDIWYLSRNIPKIDWSKIRQAFYLKLKFKGYEFEGVDQLMNPENEQRIKKAWENSLSHQIHRSELPQFEKVRNEIKQLLEILFGN